jgi:hypothetical protein
MKPDLCRDFEVHADDGGWRVVTPWRYGDRDRVVIWAVPTNGGWRVDDNGEAAFRMALDGGDPDSQRVRTWLSTVPPMLGASWNPDEQRLETFPDEKNLASSIHAVAEVSALLGSLSLAREARTPSTFKDEVIAMLHEVSKETGIEARFEVPLDQRQVLVADCLFLSERPLAIIVAGSVERLLEAELAWSEARRTGDQTRIVAVTEGDGAGIPRRRIDQAQFFTDKTLPFRGFEILLRQNIAESLRH